MLSNYVKYPEMNKKELVTEGVFAGVICLFLQGGGNALAKTPLVRKCANYIIGANNFGYKIARYLDAKTLETVMGFSITAATFSAYHAIRSGYYVTSTWIEKKINDFIDATDDGFFNKELVCGD